MQFAVRLGRFFASNAIFGTALVLLFATTAAAQQVPAKNDVTPPAQQSAALSSVSITQAPLRLLIGPGDELEISVYGISELEQKARVDSNGEISLALAGNVRVAGLTAEEAQQAIEARYIEGGFLKNPHVTVYVKEYTTQSVTVAGEVGKPGVYSLSSGRRLLDLILVAGGLTEKAGRTVSITRAADRGNPIVLTLSDAPADVAENNIEILAGDTIVVSRAGIVYVIGEVNRAGGFIMENSGNMTVAQALAKAAGPTGLASLNNTKIIRRTPEGLQNIALEAKKILEAKAPDVPLQPEDIVYVPNSRSKSLLNRSSNSIFVLLTGLALYR